LLRLQKVSNSLACLQGLDHDGKSRVRKHETAAAAGTGENDTLLVVDVEMGKVPEQTIQVLHHNVDKIEALEAELEKVKASMHARFQALEEHRKS
jgi:hypothetical protein